MRIRNLLLTVIATSFLSVLGQGSSSAAEQGLAVGKVVPEFSALDDKGKKWNSKDHVGKKIVVVYFYPADMTGGCTKQACAFRDDMPKLSGANVEVVGVSGDTVGNHQLFIKAHGLNFALLADTEGTVAKTFGVPVRKGGSIVRTIDNEEFTLTRNLTTARWTFVIGLDGKLAHKNTSVNAAQDSKAVMEVVKKLSK
ncbi:MAG: peroxiredoxin [Planctomycetaceae bacterium]|nr:peroxiredoxin [Planctomycetaceae bacterium]